MKAEKLRASNDSGKKRTKKILLVDDDEPTQLYIRRMLQKAGYTVCIAENGRDCLCRLEQEEFDCVLMDIRMPVMDGMETTRQIRTVDNGCRDTPVIALTAYVSSEARETFLQAGMDDFIPKPTDNHTLLNTLKKYL